MADFATKSTEKLLNELTTSKEFELFMEENQASIAVVPIGEALEKMLSEKGMKKAEVIRASEMQEATCYAIFSGLRHPDRKRVLPLLIALGAGIDEIQTTLKRAGYATLYARNPFDCIVIYGIVHGYSVAEINDKLFEYGEPTLG